MDDICDKAKILQDWLKPKIGWVPLDDCIEITRELQMKYDTPVCPTCGEEYSGDCGPCSVGYCQG